MSRRDWFEGLSPAEIAALQKIGITSAADLWRTLGRNRRLRVKRLAILSGIPEGRLIAVISALALDDEPPMPGTTWSRQGITWMLILIMPMLALVFILLRVSLPALWGESHGGVIAARSLNRGQVLVSADLFSSILPMAEDYFTRTNQLEGWVLAKDIPAGLPLHFNDVLRPQVAARRDIISGTILTSQEISLTWTTFQPDAVLSLKQALGYRAIQPFQQDEILLGRFLEPATTSGSQAVVHATNGVPAYHLIEPDDVTIREALSDPATFANTDEVIGGYLLQALPPGAPIRREIVIPASIISGRMLLSFPVSSGISPGVMPGSPVDILLYPLLIDDKFSDEAIVIKEVIVIAIQPTGSVQTLTVALREEQATQMMSLLTTSKIYVAQRY